MDWIETIVNSKPIKVAATVAWLAFVGTCYYAETKSKDFRKIQEVATRPVPRHFNHRVSPDYVDTSLVCLYKIK
jgi:hypothetical protein